MKPEVEKKSWSALYNTLALVIFNTILIFILGNGAIGILLTMVEPTPTQDQRIIAHFGQGTLEKVYPGKTWPEIKTLLQETWSRTYLYEPFVQFREPPMEGQFVHVSQAGFRTHGPPIPWPPDRQKMNVFLFGGSTVFGYGVGDAETIAAHLEKRLAKTTQRPVHVYNFGQGFYYSSQELIQFQRLLVHGIQPDMAIFLDGLNDFFHDKDQPFFTERLRDAMSKTSPAQHLQAWAADWAVVRLANKVAKRLSPQTIPSPENNARTITSVIDRYLANQRLIQASGAAHGIPTLFAWQPVPTYHHQPHQHLVQGDLKEHALSGPGYETLAQRLQSTPLGPHFVWCADVQKGSQELLYVDRVHYNSPMSDRIAECLMNGIVQMPTTHMLPSSNG